mmetsp:Transcript_6577/g.9508  ORF Transcript_6577/g.9508 Transcript_6577/m.9508 type:complete len:175 (+) Transcript_6577:49-573(+)
MMKLMLHSHFLSVVVLIVSCTLTCIPFAHGFNRGLASNNMKQISSYALSRTNHIPFRRTEDFIALSSAVYESKSSTSIFAGKRGDESNFTSSSERRGNYIFGFALVLIIWSFSIDPKLRREHICPTNNCVENRERCYDCITLKEWVGEVSDYYNNGGGISFDFSVDPNSNLLVK